MWSSTIGVSSVRREEPLVPDRLARRPAAGPQRGRRGALARQPQAPVADVVEQDHLPRLGPGAAARRRASRAGLRCRSGGRPRAARPAAPRRRRGRSGPRARLGRRSLAQRAASSITIALPAAPLLAPTKPARLDECVVVGADHDPRARRPGRVPTMLRRPGWPGTPRSARGAAAAQVLGQPAQLRRARRALAVAHLALVSAYARRRRSDRACAWSRPPAPASTSAARGRGRRTSRSRSTPRRAMRRRRGRCCARRKGGRSGGARRKAVRWNRPRVPWSSAPAGSRPPAGAACWASPGRRGPASRRWRSGSWPRSADVARLVPMDGFHFAQAELVRLGRRGPQGRARHVRRRRLRRRCWPGCGAPSRRRLRARVPARDRGADRRRGRRAARGAAGGHRGQLPAAVAGESSRCSTSRGTSRRPTSRPGWSA